jgi:hypothetical protein
MPIPIKSKVVNEFADEIAVAEILASWSIEEIKQLLCEIEAELRKRPYLMRIERSGRHANASCTDLAMSCQPA